MKFKLIQITGLLIFVMSIVYIAQTPVGYGHSEDQHPPEFYVDKDGTNKGAEKIGPDGKKRKDPRIDDEYSDSSGNGTESASSWKMVYYASGQINGGHKKDKDAEQVYGARVDLSASAGNSSCSGSAAPSLTDDMGLTGDNPGWSGNAQIILTIKAKDDAHLRKRMWLGTGFHEWCTLVNVQEAKLDTEQQNIGIQVQETTITSKKSGTIGAALGYGPASISATWSSGSDVAREGVVCAYAFGIDAKLVSTAHESVSPQLDKTAWVTGDLGEILKPANITAVYKGKHECYGSFGGGDLDD